MLAGNVFWGTFPTHPVFTRSKSTMEILEQCIKYVQT